MSVYKPPAPGQAIELITTTIEDAASGDNTIIAAPGTGLRIAIVHFNFIARGDVNVRLLSDAVQKSGLYNVLANQGFSFDGGIYAPLLMELNDAFIINLSAAVGIDGFVTHYVQRG